MIRITSRVVNKMSNMFMNDLFGNALKEFVRSEDLRLSLLRGEIESLANYY